MLIQRERRIRGIFKCKNNLYALNYLWLYICSNMATGGHNPFRTSATDPRPRGGWHRTTSASDKEDNISNHSSNPLEHRPNNWVYPQCPIIAVMYILTKSKSTSFSYWYLLFMLIIFLLKKYLSASFLLITL